MSARPVFKQLVIDYYQGAYGPTVRLSTDERDDLKTLSAVFRGVRADRAVDLAAWPGTRCEHTGRILLQSGAGRSETRSSALVNGVTVEWIQSDEGWLESAELVEGMLDGDGPCHQYLTRDAEDDILIEVAYRDG